MKTVILIILCFITVIFTIIDFSAILSNSEIDEEEIISKIIEENEEKKNG